MGRVLWWFVVEVNGELVVGRHLVHHFLTKKYIFSPPFLEGILKSSSWWTGDMLRNCSWDGVFRRQWKIKSKWNRRNLINSEKEKLLSCWWPPDFLHLLSLTYRKGEYGHWAEELLCQGAWSAEWRKWSHSSLVSTIVPPNLQQFSYHLV